MVLERLDEGARPDRPSSGPCCTWMIYVMDLHTHPSLAVLFPHLSPRLLHRSTRIEAGSPEGGKASGGLMTTLFSCCSRPDLSAVIPVPVYSSCERAYDRGIPLVREHRAWKRS